MCNDAFTVHRATHSGISRCWARVCEHQDQPVAWAGGQLKITVTSVRYNGSDVASVLLGDRGWFTNSLDACDVGRCCTAAQQHNDRSILLELFKAPGSGARRTIHAVTNV